jgi:MscS family membrane protein
MRLAARIAILFSVALWLITDFVPPAYTQTSIFGLSGDTSQKENQQEDPLGRTTPRKALTGFVRAAALGNFQNAREYLQLSLRIPPEKADELVLQLQTLLDHAYLDDLDDLNDQEGGSINDGLPDNLEDGGSIEVQGEKLKILLVRSTHDSLGPLWLVSSGTLNKIPELYAKFEKSGFEEKVPLPWLKTKIFRLSLWVLISALILLPVFYGISWLLIHGIISLYHLIKKLTGREVSPHHPKAAKPLIYQLTLILHYWALTRLDLPLLYRQYYQRLIYILGLVFLTWLLFIFIDGLTNRLESKLRTMERLSIHSTLLLVGKILKAIVLGSLALAIIRSVGFNINPALATLGLGGIALAFAAQKSLENLFGGISLLSDRAIQVGDLCRIGTTLGTVEDIGLRSTRIRTVDRTLLLVPNGSLASDNLENFSRRDKFLFKQVLGLRYQTKPEQLRKLKILIGGYLEEHPMVEREHLRVQLIRFGPYSLDLEIIAYITADHPDEFLTIQEQLLFRILDFVEEAGAEIAYPSQTTYLGRDTLFPVPAPAPSVDQKK